MDELVVAFFAWHVKVNDLVLVGIIDVEGGLESVIKSQSRLTLMWSSEDYSFSTTEPRVDDMASRKVVLPTPESPTIEILNLKW